MVLEPVLKHIHKLEVSVDPEPKRLKLQQQQHQQPHHQLRTSASLQGLGGLSRIPEGDVEMTPPASMTMKNEAIMSE